MYLLPILQLASYAVMCNGRIKWNKPKAVHTVDLL